MSDIESKPGLVIIQIDGLSRPGLDDVLAAGRMPVLGALISSGRLTLSRWFTLLPPCTPASQAGILHGDNTAIPGFRWYEKSANRLFVANHAADAAEIERRLSTGDGLLAGSGVSIGNLLAGDAAISHLTMATIGGDGPARGPTDRGTFSRDPRSYLRIVVEMIYELLAEIVQARRQRRQNVRPRMPRGVRYALERVVTNVPLRVLATWTVIHEIEVGRPVIYIDYTGYDEISHHCGPGRPESAGAAEKIDRSLGHVLDAIATAPRAYRLVVLSDHGQSLGATFRQRYGSSLVQLIAAQTGESTTFHVATDPAEYADGFTRIGYQILGSKAATVEGLLARRPGRNHRRASRLVDGHGAPLATPADVQVADVVVCASGNLGLVYFTSTPGQMTGEDIESRYPGLIESLVRHPGIGAIVVRSASGVRAIGIAGTNDVEKDRVVGLDPLAVYGPHAAEGIRRVAGFENSGDLIAIGSYDPGTNEVVSFEELVGSHGGLGGDQGEPFIAYPAGWHLDEGPLIGSPSVNRQLRRWMSSLGIGAHVESSDASGAADAGDSSAASGASDRSSSSASARSAAMETAS